MMNLKRPTLLLDRKKCLKNLETLIVKTRASNIRFRPHFKTHQSAAIGQWFRDYGVQHITVSSVNMAQYFARDGWKDITLALPLNHHEIDDLNHFESDIAINLLISSVETAEYLTRHATRKFGCYIKIDTGFHRCGLNISEIPTIRTILKTLSNHSLIEIKGLLSHFGHTYSATDTEKVTQIYHDGVSLLQDIREYFISDYPGLEISVGDTPSCSMLPGFPGVDEVRPGNFIFYDIMQEQIGSCQWSDIAVGLACPVIEVQPERKEVITYGGSVHLSKDYLTDPSGDKKFGAVCLPGKKAWSAPLEGCFVKSLSQEHGILSCSDTFLSQAKPGDWIVILPVHSCLTASNMGEYLTLDGLKIKMMGKD
ncbi:MAG: alanine racemase [Bacteroidales bacterium]